MNGKVKWYNEEKGYGFIETEEGKDVFVHRSGISQATRRLNEGDEVSFELKQGDRGPSAVNVVVE